MSIPQRFEETKAEVRLRVLEKTKCVRFTDGRAAGRFADAAGGRFGVHGGGVGENL